MRGVALITGAASGIGAATARLLSERGWRVAGLDLSKSDTELSVVADVTDPEAVRAAAGRAAAELGQVSALVTAAGYHESAPVDELGPDRWRRMLSVHLGGTANACRAVVPPMLEAGSGRIVTVASELALSGSPGDAHYTAAKGAIIGFTRSLGWELAARGVRVNCVAPGPTDTPLLPPGSRDRSPEYLGTLTLGRLVRPGEVAETVALLLEEGDYFAGQTLSPNAGAVI